MSGIGGCGREFETQEGSIGFSILCPTGMFDNELSSDTSSRNPESLQDAPQ